MNNSKYFIIYIIGSICLMLVSYVLFFIFDMLDATHAIVDKKIMKKWGVNKNYTIEFGKQYSTESRMQNLQNLEEDLNIELPSFIPMPPIEGVRGRERCNVFLGNYRIGYNDSINFSDIILTEKLCSIEYRLIDALKKTSSYQIEEKKDWESSTLTLTNNNQILLEMYEVIKTEIYVNEIVSGFITASGEKLFVTNIPQEKIERSNQNGAFVCNLIGVEEQTDTATIGIWGKICKVKDYEFIQPIVFGRPLRINESVVLPELVIVDKKIDKKHKLKHDIMKLKESKSRRECLKFAEHWLQAARHEHSSVHSFHQVVLDLKSLQAPSKLIEKCLSAQRDEIKHEKITLMIGNLMMGALELPQYRIIPLEHYALHKRTVDEFKKQNYQDAIVGELKSAKELKAIAKQFSSTPILSKIINNIATDEFQHAELGNEIDLFLDTMLECSY